MSSQPLATSPSSPSDSGTRVSLSATILFNKQSVTINSQDVTKLKEQGVKFELTTPVDMGSIDKMIDWMHEELHLPLQSKEVDDIVKNQIPAPFSEPLQSILNANITLDVLKIDTQASTYAVGVGVTPEPALNILDILKVERIGIQVTSGGGAGSPSSP